MESLDGLMLYELLELVGRGISTEVFKAMHKETKLWVLRTRGLRDMVEIGMNTFVHSGLKLCEYTDMCPHQMQLETVPCVGKTSAS